MTTKTRQQLVNRALAGLLKLPATQAANPEDYAAVNGYVDGLIEQLRIRRIVSVDNLASIPVEWFDPLAVLVASAAAPEFGIQYPEVTASNPNPVRTAEMTLRELTYALPTRETLQVEYF